jgi:hypothetical protein
VTDLRITVAVQEPDRPYRLMFVGGSPTGHIYQAHSKADVEALAADLNAEVVWEDDDDSFLPVGHSRPQA